jgi:hypothetical protein
MTRFARGLSYLVCTVAFVSSAHAIVPDPVLSVTPDCIRLCPAGNLPVNVQVIGTDGNPLGGNDVRMVFNAGCTSLKERPACTQPTVLTQVANGSGQVTFNPQIGGCCSVAGSVVIEADPGAVTLLPIYDSVGSNDNNGNGVSNLSDFVNFQAAFLTANTCHDLSGCNTTVNLSDFVIFQGHFLHGTACP